jgi:hypothetical protein
MDDVISRIAAGTPVSPDQVTGRCDDVQNYMFFRNLVVMRDKIESLMSLDRHEVDAALSDGHDWAADHIAAAAENISQVEDWLVSELTKP